MEEIEKQELEKKLIKFKKSLEERLQQEYQEKLKNTSEEEKQQEEIKLTEIARIKYYNEFELKTKIKDLILKLQDIYIVELKNGNNTTYEIYTKNLQHKIAEINIEGKIQFTDNKIDDNTTLEEIEENNSNKDNFEFTKEELEEIEQKQDKEKEEQQEKQQEEEKDDKEETQQENQAELLEDTEKSTEKLEEELKLDKGDIKSCTKLNLNGKDNIFRNKVKESRKYDAIKLVYISSQDSFRFVGLKKGQPPKYLETIEPSKETMKTSMNIEGEKGEVEQQNIHGLMKFTESTDYDFSIKIGQYGYIELNVLRKDPVTNKYISTKLETTSQRPKEKQKEINELMDKNKNKRIAEEIQEYEKEKHEKGKDAKININDISDKGRQQKQQIKEKTEEEEQHERTLDENVKKYYY